MNLNDALRYIASQATVAGAALRRADWAKGKVVRHATAEEQATRHAYVLVSGGVVVTFDATAEELAADDWEVSTPDGTPIAPAAEPKPEPKPASETAPQSPKAKESAAR